MTRTGAPLGTLLVAIALLTGMAAAQDPSEVLASLTGSSSERNCADTGASVEIAGVGRAVYDRILFDGATGEARLSGEVCIELNGGAVSLRAGEVHLTGLAVTPGAVGAPHLQADMARLYLAGWRLGIERLEGPIDALLATGVVLLGPGVVGLASRAKLGDDPQLFELSLATPNYLIQALEGRLSDGEVELLQASATTCACGIERYRLFGDVLRAGVGEDGSAIGTTIERPRVRILGLEIPLGERLEFRADGRDLPLPVTIEARDDLGTVAVLQRRPDASTVFELGASTEPDPYPIASLRVRSGGEVAGIAFDRRGLTLSGRSRHALGSDGWASALVVSDLRGDDGLLRVGAEAGWQTATGLDQLGVPGGSASLRVQAGAEVAAEPNVRAGASPAGPTAVRVPLGLEVSAAAPLAPGATASLKIEAAARGYRSVAPDATTGLAALTVTPAMTLEQGDLRVRLHASRRWVAGASPFEFDALSARSRVGASASLQAQALKGQAQVEWRLAPERPGAEDLEASVRAPVELGAGWTLTPAIQLDAAGLYGGSAKEDWLEARLDVRGQVGLQAGVRYRLSLDPWAARSLTVQAGYTPTVDAYAGDASLSAKAVWDLAGATPGDLDRLELSARWPIELGTPLASVRLVPTLSADLAPWLSNAEAPILIEHGLTVQLRDCCGTVRVGYLRSEDGFTLDLGLILPPLRFEELMPDELPALPPAYGETR